MVSYINLITFTNKIKIRMKLEIIFFQKHIFIFLAYEAEKQLEEIFKIEDEDIVIFLFLLKKSCS